MNCIKARSVVKLFFVFSLSAFLLAPLCSKGRASYKEANKLIKQKKQDVALSKIIEMIEKHPESLNMATDSIKKAMKNQDKFAEEFLKIIEQLYKDPDDNTKILNIIAVLEKLNTAMEPQMQDFLQRIKYSSIYARNRIKFNNLMKQGIELINSEKYAEAHLTFLQGYSICYDEYRNAYSETERLEKTEIALNAIREAGHSLRKEDSKFLMALNAYRNMLRDNILKIDPEIVKNFENETELMHEIGKEVFTNGEQLNVFLQDDEKNEDFQVDSFLPYATRLTMGRLNATEYEGAQGAIDAAIMNRLLNLENYILTLVRDGLDSFFRKFTFGSSLGGVVDVLNNYILEYERVVSLVEKLNVDYTRFPLNQKVHKENIASTSELKELLENSLLVYNDFFEIKSHNYVLEEYGGENNISDIRALSVAYSSLLPLERQLKGYSFDALSSGAKELGGLQEKLIGNIKSLYQEKLDGYASLKNVLGVEFCDRHEEQIATAQSLIEGFHSIGSGINEMVRSPTEALGQFEKEELSIKEEIKILDEAISFISNIKGEIEKKDSTKASLDGIIESERRLRSFLKDIENYSTFAKNNIFKMNLAKQEAEFRYNEALRNLRNSEFSSARANIERSQVKSNEALAFENDAEYRKLVDERLAKLGLEINQRENELVVREVRSSLEKAKNLYFNGNFGEAENVLVRANTRWHSTNIEENEEIQNWLNITQMASVMKSGRSIPQSAVLYPQMSQLLSNSKQLYNEAAKTIKSDRENALKKLNEAKSNIKQVLLVYPLNEEAGGMSLRIDQLIDPENFSSQVKRKIEKIRGSYRRNPQADYAELLNLYIMDKNFPGLIKLKDEVEIYLGIKIVPPDTSQIDRALALTQEADAIFKRGEKARYEEALQKLNQAIKLNPSNERAALLKDRLQMAIGGTAIAVLSYANEEKYRKAVLALQGGNKITAIALVEELLKDAEGRKSAKVHDLKKRINAQL